VSPGRSTAPHGAAQLSGALGTVALADVLQLLELGRKTGVLAVDGGEGGGGSFGSPKAPSRARATRSVAPRLAPRTRSPLR
jgi:hypothetical protein